MDDDSHQQMEAITAKFAAELPTRIRSIRVAFESIEWDAVDPDALDGLRAQVHRLAGSAGTFGRDDVSQIAAEVARRLQIIAASEDPDPVIWNALEHRITELEQSGLTLRPRSTGDQERSCRERLLHPRVDVVDDDASLVHAIGSILAGAGYRVASFEDPASFVENCRLSGPPDVVLMDLDFPGDGRIAGAEALASLRAEFDPPPLAVVISSHDDLPSRLAAYRAGACRYLLKPLDTRQLLQILDRLTSRAVQTAYRVMIVDDDERLAEMNAAVLDSGGFVTEVLTQPLQLLDRLRVFQPDVLLLDVYMPEASGPELAAVLREDESLSWLPILFLSAETDPGKHALALAHGGDDFLIKPVRPAYLLAAVKARAWRARRARADFESLRGGDR